MIEARDQRVHAIVYINDSREELGERIVALEDENERLREQIYWLKKGDVLHVLTDQELADQQRHERETQASITALDDENAKLRELVLDAWGNGHPDRSCDGCDIRNECHDDIERMRKDGMLRFSRCLFELQIEERMRELGIEVE